MVEFLVIYLFVVPLVILWAVALWDNWRMAGRSVAAKIGWSAVVVLLPVVGAAIYFAVRPIPPAAAPARGRSGGIAVVDELETLIAAHDRGELSEERYVAEKAKLFAPKRPEDSGPSTPT